MHAFLSFSQCISTGNRSHIIPLPFPFHHEKYLHLTQNCLLVEETPKSKTRENSYSSKILLSLISEKSAEETREESRQEAALRVNAQRAKARAKDPGSWCFIRHLKIARETREREREGEAGLLGRFIRT